MTKRTPRPGIEPGSPAWQAGILTTILTRIVYPSNTTRNTISQFIPHYLLTSHIHTHPPPNTFIYDSLRYVHNHYLLYRPRRHIYPLLFHDESRSALSLTNTIQWNIRLLFFHRVSFLWLNMMHPRNTSRKSVYTRIKYLYFRLEISPPPSAKKGFCIALGDLYISFQAYTSPCRVKKLF